MVELTEEQLRALAGPAAGPLRLIDPRTREAFVLLRVQEYERLKAEREEPYDDSPWGRDELQSLAWETAERAGWEGEEESASEGQPALQGPSIGERHGTCVSHPGATTAVSSMTSIGLDGSDESNTRIRYRPALA